MTKISVAKSVLSKTPKVIRDLPDVEYRLTKIENKRESFYVQAGKTQSGDLEIVDVEGDPAIRVMRGLSAYLRTSPIVQILDQTKDALIIETEGGIYRLEKLKVEQDN